MLVKHNLSPFYDMSKTKLVFWSKSTSKGYVIDDVIIVESQDNTVHPFTEMNLPINSDEKTISQLIVSNIGNVNIEAVNQLWGDSILIKPGDILKCTFNTKGSKFIEFRIPKTSIAKFKAKASIINRGSLISDVYLPNKESLPQDKKPLLPPEGDYKEIEPTRG